MQVFMQHCKLASTAAPSTLRTRVGSERLLELAAVRDSDLLAGRAAAAANGLNLQDHVHALDDCKNNEPRSVERLQ